MYNITKDKSFENALRIKLGKKFKLHYMFSSNVSGTKELFKSTKYYGLSSRSMSYIWASIILGIIIGGIFASIVPLLLILLEGMFLVYKIWKIKKLDTEIPIAMFSLSYKVECDGKFYVNKIISTPKQYSEFIQIEQGKWVDIIRKNYEIDKRKVIDQVWDDIHIQMRRSPS